MQSSQQPVPRFGDWDDNKELSYSIIFDKARADKERNLISSIDPAAYCAFHNARELKDPNAPPPHQNVFNSGDMASGKRVAHSYHGMGNRDFGDSSLEAQSAGGRISMGKEVSNHFQSWHPSNGRPGLSSWVQPSDSPRQMMALNEARTTGDYLQVSGHPSGLAYEGYQGRPSNKSTSSAGLERKFWENAVEMNPTPLKLARSQRSSESGRNVGVSDKPAVPKFGDWDPSDASSGVGFTQVFDRVRDEKKLKSSQKNSVQRVAPGRLDEDLYNPSRLSQVPIVPEKKKGWARFLCCVNSDSVASKPRAYSGV